MNWYYAVAGEQVGPVSEEELLGLVRSGKIQSDTLVWHEGLPQWQVYGYVKPEPGIPPMSSSPPIVVPPPVHRTLATQPTRPKEGVSCPKCRTALPGSLFNLGKLVACPGCGSPLEVSVFPALFRQIAEGKSPETILVEGEASCFYHPQKRATIPCAICGRFLCALCDVELNDQHLCPGCLDTGRKKGKLVQLENRRTLHDSSALVLSVIPVICMWPISLVTAPIAVFLAVYSWYQPASILPRTRIRSYLAIVFGLLQITVWVLFFTGVLHTFISKMK